MTNYAVGHLAEEHAAKYLEKRGYEVLALNWRNRYGEIDIVANRKKAMYFIEVKYRKTSAQGMGLDYITPRKIEQMSFAAQMWVSENKWNKDYYLGAIEVSGPDFVITRFLPQLD